MSAAGSCAPSLERLRAVAQPPEVRSRKNAEHWTAQLYLRHISIYLTYWLVRTRITANGVTWLMIVSGWCIAISLVFVPGIWGALLALFFSQLQMYLDCCDGEVARWRGTKGAMGVFLDRVGHYTTEGMVAFALGIRAAGELLDLFPVLLGVPVAGAGLLVYGLAGSMLASLVLLNKALNDMVHVSRAFNQLDQLPDSANSTAVTHGVLARLKAVAKFVPFHRIYHSVEMSILAVLAAIFSLVWTSFGAVPTGGNTEFSASGLLMVPELVGERFLVMLMVPLCLLSVIGHFLAIVASRRLR